MKSCETCVKRKECEICTKYNGETLPVTLARTCNEYETTAEDADVICAFCGKPRSSCTCRLSSTSDLKFYLYEEDWG